MFGQLNCGFGQGPSNIPHHLVSQSAMFMKGLYTDGQEPSTRPIYIHVVLSMVTGSYVDVERFNFDRIRRDEICCAFDVPLFLNKISVDDRIRYSFINRFEIQGYHNLDKSSQYASNTFQFSPKTSYICYPVSIILSDLAIFRMDVQRAIKTPIKSNQLRNINTTRRGSRASKRQYIFS